MFLLKFKSCRRQLFKKKFQDSDSFIQRCGQPILDFVVLFFSLYLYFLLWLVSSLFGPLMKLSNELSTRKHWKYFWPVCYFFFIYVYLVFVIVLNYFCSFTFFIVFFNCTCISSVSLHFPLFLFSIFTYVYSKSFWFFILFLFY